MGGCVVVWVVGVVCCVCVMCVCAVCVLCEGRREGRGKGRKWTVAAENKNPT